MEYLDIIRKMSGDLNIYGVFDDLNRPDLNKLIRNKDSIAEFTTSIYQNLLEQLEGNGRQNILACIIMGHVIETFHIAVLNLRDFSEHKEAISRLFGQRLVFNQFYDYFSAYRSDKDVNKVLNEADKLKEFFDHLKISKTKHKIVRDSTGNIIIKGGETVIFEEDDFNLFKKYVNELRGKIVNNAF
jgi:hypothetical protein